MLGKELSRKSIRYNQHIIEALGNIGSASALPYLEAYQRHLITVEPQDPEACRDVHYIWGQSMDSLAKVIRQLHEHGHNF